MQIKFAALIVALAIFTAATTAAPAESDSHNNIQQLIKSMAGQQAFPAGSPAMNPSLMRHVIENVVNKVLAKGGCPKGFTKDMCNQPATFYVWLRELRDQALYKEIQENTKTELAKAMAKYYSLVAQFQTQQQRINLLKQRIMLQHAKEQEAIAIGNEAGSALTASQNQGENADAKIAANNVTTTQQSVVTLSAERPNAPKHAVRKGSKVKRPKLSPKKPVNRNNS